MFATAIPFPPMTRLEELLYVCPRLSDEVLAEARALDPALLEEIVTSLLVAEIATPTYATAPARAAVLAGELGLSGAVPALVRCMLALPADHPLHDSVRTALVHLGRASLEALLAAFDACDTPVDRLAFAEVLARLPVRDDRMRAAFVRILEENPLEGSRFLAHHGDWRAVPDLVRALDRLRASPTADCDLCAGMDLETLANTIEVLGGSITGEQRVGIEQVLRKGDRHWLPWRDVPTPPAIRPVHPGRNDPCHCGSGKKYKRCHLEADERAARN